MNDATDLPHARKALRPPQHGVQEAAPDAVRIVRHAHALSGRAQRRGGAQLGRGGRRSGLQRLHAHRGRSREAPFAAIRPVGPDLGRRGRAPHDPALDPAGPRQGALGLVVPLRQTALRPPAIMRTPSTGNRFMSETSPLANSRTETAAIGWQGALDEVDTEHDLVSVTRDFLATWTPEEIVKLPKPLRPWK